MTSKFDLLKAEMKKRGMNVPDSVIREAIRRKDAGKGAEAPKKKKKKIVKSTKYANEKEKADAKAKKPRKKIVKSALPKAQSNMKKTKITATQLKNLKKYYGRINPNKAFSKSLNAGNILRKKVLAGETEYSQGDHATLMADHKRILLEMMYQKSKK
jgi:hypothetical protein